jgi:hypothetical protein|tara:strand:+ start:3677 stop:3787 length:111 start_codon:yes stop_codon:yes gene_type:complete
MRDENWRGVEFSALGGADGEARRPTSVDDRGCVFLG